MGCEEADYLGLDESVRVVWRHGHIDRLLAQDRANQPAGCPQVLLRDSLVQDGITDQAESVPATFLPRNPVDREEVRQIRCQQEVDRVRQLVLDLARP